MIAIRILLIPVRGEQRVDFGKRYWTTLQGAGQTQDKVAPTQFCLTLPECLSGQTLDAIPVDCFSDQSLGDDQREPRIPQ